MGNYNPDAPVVLGNEFVGIREDNIVLTNDTDSVEYGYTMTLAGSRTLQDARFYLDGPDVVPQQFHQVSVNVYPQGAEALSGPIQKVVVPLSSTGNTILDPSGTSVAVYVASVNSITPGSAATPSQIARAVTSQHDGSYIRVAMGNVGDAQGPMITAFFDIASYAAQLQGKRILGLTVVIQMDDFGNPTDAQAIATGTQMHVGMVSGGTVLYASDDLQRFPIQNTNPLWNGNIANNSNQATNWTAAQLASSAVKWTMFRLPPTAPNTFNFLYTYSISYLALEITYCEEQRVATGTFMQYVQNTANTQIVPMRVPLTQALNPVLAAGNYTVTVSGPFTAASTQALAAETPDPELPPLNALRSLYALTGLSGVKVTKPFPPENSVGQTFSSAPSDLLPQVSLHLSTGPVLESHVYGRRAEIPVYGALTPSQVISNATGATVTATQARFYARRFGATSTSLQLTNGSVTRSCTPAQLDALPAIVDGWRELTLPLSGSAPIATGTSTWTWSAAGENVGSRWEVLGVTAPAVSGLPGNPRQPVVPAAQLLDTATYLQPNGSSVNLTWQAPYASGSGADASSDAVLMLSQAPAVPGSLTVTPAVQTLVTAVDCLQPPKSIPTGMYYNRITWASTGATGSAFGYTELQRSDAYDGTWQTIMSTTSAAVTGYNDYEARVGVLSSYRIRQANALGFLGAFSGTATGLVASPGVTGRGVTNSVLMFSSNERQAGGVNAAYTYEAPDTAEPFTFPEASRVNLQWMYQQDFLTAFHPTERGGEQFSRTLLVAQMAIAGPIQEQGFRTLRDLGWASTTYICVRNELGDRWYANVQVPDGTFTHNRAIQVASVQVTETYTTPSVVDPAVQQ